MDLAALLEKHDLSEPNAREIMLAKQMFDTLDKAYPGHLWGISVSEHHGIADIRNFGLSGNWGYRLKLVDHYTASDWDRETRRAGGEILERYRVARTRVNEEQLAYLPTDFAGRHKADL
ncbi:MAG TPA: hypothetical protein VIL30_16710 [Ramlibacter sp.]|jgi:hypothetical protein